MNREIKVALFLLICLVGLIGYFEYKKSPVVDNEEVIGVETDIGNEIVEPGLEINEATELLSSKGSEVEPTNAEEVETVVNNDIASTEEIKSDVPEPQNTEIETDETVTEDRAVIEKELVKVDVGSVPEVIPASYKVIKGDTLSQISQKYIGSIKYLPLIMEKNPELRVDQLYAGIEIKLPTRTEVETYKKLNLAQSRIIPKGASAYIIEAGDTMNKISIKKFGDRSKVKEILEMNPNVDPRKLLIGSLLILPQN